MSLHRIRENDDRPYFRTTLKIAGSPVDLTGATVIFHMADEAGIVKINRAASKIQSSPTVNVGVVEFRFDSSLGETNLPGSYIAEWEVTFADGTTQTFPTRGRDRVQVLAEVA